MIVVVDLEILTADALYCLIRVTIETPSLYFVTMGGIRNLAALKLTSKFIRKVTCRRKYVRMYSFG